MAELGSVRQDRYGLRGPHRFGRSGSVLLGVARKGIVGQGRCGEDSQGTCGMGRQGEVRQVSCGLESLGTDGIGLVRFGRIGGALLGALRYCIVACGSSRLGRQGNFNTFDYGKEV